MPKTFVDLLEGISNLLAESRSDVQAGLLRDLVDVIKKAGPLSSRQLFERLSGPWPETATLQSAPARTLTPFLGRLGTLFSEQGAARAGGELLRLSEILEQQKLFSVQAFEAKLRPPARAPKRSGSRTIVHTEQFDVRRMVEDLTAAERNDAAFEQLVKKLAARGAPTKQQVCEVAARYLGAAPAFATKQAAIRAIQETHVRRQRFESHLELIKRS